MGHWAYLRLFQSRSLEEEYKQPLEAVLGLKRLVGKGLETKRERKIILYGKNMEEIFQISSELEKKNTLIGLRRFCHGHITVV